jgi:hypothetical protein
MPRRPPGGGKPGYANRLTVAHRRLLLEEPPPEQHQPRGWVKPEGLTSSALAKIDPDIALGMEFLAGLDARLRVIDIELRLGRQQLSMIDRRLEVAVTHNANQIKDAIEAFGARLAALEAAMRALLDRKG